MTRVVERASKSRRDQAAPPGFSSRRGIIGVLIFDADRLATSSGDLQSEAAVVILMPDRRIGFGADLTHEPLSDERRRDLRCRRGIQVGGSRCESIVLSCG